MAKGKGKAEAQEAPRADLLEKDPSEAHEALAEFIAEQTGYDPDVKTVQMVRVLYRPFIRSEEHQSRLDGARSAREQAEAEKAERRAEREAAAASKESKASAKAEAPRKASKGKAKAVDNGGDEAQASAAPKKSGKKNKAKATAESPF
jgi:hypothetical protein